MAKWRQVTEWLVRALLRLSSAKVVVLFVALAVAVSLLIVATIDLAWDNRFSAELEFAGFVTPLLDGLLVVGLLNILLTKLKDKAARLTDAETNLNAAQRIAHLGNWTRERDSGMITWSAEMFRIFELDPQQQPTYAEQLARIHPDDRSEVAAAYAQSEAEHRPYEITHRLLLGGGRVKYVHQRGETRFDHRRRPLGTIGTVQDITERVLLEQALEKLATHDTLTGIHNRYRMNEQIRQEIEVAARYGMALTVTMFDIDLFKQINDSQGHDVGDAVLQHVAAVTRGVLRKSDLFARWGGDEFMVLSHHTDLAAGRLLAERIRAAIGATPFAAGTPLTVSVGVTSWEPGDTSESLLKRADEALYAAKNSGRNCVTTLTTAD